MWELGASAGARDGPLGVGPGGISPQPVGREVDQPMLSLWRLLAVTGPARGAIIREFTMEPCYVIRASFLSRTSTSTGWR